MSFGKSHLQASVITLIVGTIGAAAQTATGGIQGTVLDPSGALIPSASLRLTNTNGFAKENKSGSTGTFEFGRLVPGRYQLSVAAEGFEVLELSNVIVHPGNNTPENLVLQLPTEKQQVQVNDEGLNLDTSAASNATAIVIKGKDLDAMSDDPDQLQDELNALAGPSAGPSGGQIYIDGFTGGQLPPKSSIREIRINQNPFSAQYDKLGYGRIEILTKPGTDKFHGSAMINGNNSPFNSLNPFVNNEPPYYSTFLTGNASGALSKQSSWFASVFRRDNKSNSIVNAQLLDGNGGTYNYSAAVANPQSRLDISPRFDFQLGANNTLSIRYMYNRQKQTNSGVLQFALPQQAYNLTSQEHTVQISDTQILGAKTVNESRFQYTRARSNQAAENIDATVTVQGAFTGGGNNEGAVRDNQDRFEFQDYVTQALGKHAMNYGVRLRLTHEFNYSTSGFNGNFIYQSLSAYAAKAPSEYDVTAGTPSTGVNLFDAAIFFQDDVKLQNNLTLSYGVRYEAQNRIHDHADLAPRLTVAWAPSLLNRKSNSKTVLRGGYGWFYDRFSSTYALDAIRQNGINQQQYVVKNPTFSSDAPAPAELASLSSVAPTLYQLGPNLRAASNMQAAVGVEHQFGRKATIAATYINSRGVHQYYSDNVNAFLPETYNAATGTGTRPNGINENLYQFQSGGVYRQNQLTLNYTVRARRVSLFGFYLLNFAKGDTSGPTYFPSNQFNPGADYGRSTFDVRNRFLLGGNIQAPFGVSISPFMVTDSGTPFNITVGQDLNGDNQFNDRPSLSTIANSSSVQTSYGLFNLDPSGTERRIAYNSGTGPSQFSTNLRVSKAFGVGPRVEGSAPSGQGGPGGPGGGPPPGGGPGGGLGPGGLSGGNGGPPKLDQAVARRYTLNFAVMGRNIFNNVNLAAPVGVLQSPLFGKSNALAGGFFSSPAANRSVDLQMTFSF